MATHSAPLDEALTDPSIHQLLGLDRPKDAEPEPEPLRAAWVGPASVPIITGGQMSRTRCYDLMREGRLPFRQVGRRRFIDVRDLRRLIESS